MELTVLGCGDAFGSAGRNNTSFLFSVGTDRILVDCGATTLVQLKKHGVDISEISSIIITHFHGDHYGGLPFLMISRLYELQTKKKLTLIGPPGLEERVRALQEAMYPGTCDALEDVGVRFVSYEQNHPVSIDDLQVRAWEVAHSPASVPQGIRLSWRGKHIGYSGDTSWTPSLVDVAKGTDLFICECNFKQEVSFGHLSYEELVSKYQQFETKSFWLTHMSDEVIAMEPCMFNRLSDGQIIHF